VYEKIIKDEIVYDPRLSNTAVDLLGRMLDRDVSHRIKLSEIKTHPWVTLSGKWPMISTEENCVIEDVTEEEVERAFRPGFLFFNKVRILFVY
jgi:[calcium/calmodulin-dependent protein kinase] kinase